MTAHHHFPTDEEIEASRTEKGSFTKATLHSWGIAWPPPKGWMRELRRDRDLARPPLIGLTATELLTLNRRDQVALEEYVALFDGANEARALLDEARKLYIAKHSQTSAYVRKLRDRGLLEGDGIIRDVASD